MLDMIDPATTTAEEILAWVAGIDDIGMRYINLMQKINSKFEGHGYQAGHMHPVPTAVYRKWRDEDKIAQWGATH